MVRSDMLERPVEILLVEDNPGDVRLAREAFEEGKVRHNFHVAEDGLAAMAFLRREGGFADAPQPDIILLDLNLPGKDGRDVLAEIKSDPDLKTIPVVVLTSSSAEDDILRMYEHAANCYVTKPANFEDFAAIVRSIADFWFTVVKLPAEAARN